MDDRRADRIATSARAIRANDAGGGAIDIVGFAGAFAIGVRAAGDGWVVVSRHAVNGHETRLGYAPTEERARAKAARLGRNPAPRV